MVNLTPYDLSPNLFGEYHIGGFMTTEQDKARKHAKALHDREANLAFDSLLGVLLELGTAFKSDNKNLFRFKYMGELSKVYAILRTTEEIPPHLLEYILITKPVFENTIVQQERQKEVNNAYGVLAQYQEKYNLYNFSTPHDAKQEFKPIGH